MSQLKANEEIVDAIQKERHGREPARPTWSEVTTNHKFTVVARDDHHRKAYAEDLSLSVERRLVKLHDQEHLNGQQVLLVCRNASHQV